MNFIYNYDILEKTLIKIIFKLGGIIMTKEEINFVLEDNSYLENGTKQACVKIQDYLKNIKSIESIKYKS